MQLHFTLYNEESLRPGSVARALSILAQPMLITTVWIGAIASPISKTRMLRYRKVTPLAQGHTANIKSSESNPSNLAEQSLFLTTLNF